MLWPDNVLVIAELSCNHRGRWSEAYELMLAASRAGADAVKIQLYTPDTMTLDLPQFRVAEGQWAGRTLYDLYAETQTPGEGAKPLQGVACDLGLKFIVSVYDPSSLSFAEEHLDVWAYKVASFELTDAHLLRLVKRTGKRIIASLGMSNLSDFDLALAALEGDDPYGLEKVAFLHCVTNYPAPVAEMNLGKIRWMVNYLYDRVHMQDEVNVGFSDHSLSVEVPALAVAAGATIIEKHLTLSRANGSQDAAFSLEPDEFTEMVSRIRHAESAFGKPTADGEAVYRPYRRSVHAVRDIADGEVFTPDNVKTLRAEGGVTDLDMVYGRVATRAVARGEPVTRDDLRP